MNIIIGVLNNKRGRDLLLRGLLERGELLACCPVIRANAKQEGKDKLSMRAIDREIQAYRREKRG